MAQSATVDERLAVFEGDSVLVSSGQSLLEYVDSIVEFNAKYVQDEVDKDAEFGTFWKQVNFTKGLADEPDDDAKPEDVKAAQKLAKAVDDANNKLQAARKEAAVWAANHLGIEAATEKPEIPKEELEQMKKSVREPAVSLATTLATLAEGIGAIDPSKKATILEWLGQYPIPQIGRKGKLDVTSTAAQAPRYRVDITANKDGEVLWTVAGFTKAAAQKNSPSADEFRKAYEANGAKGTTEFEHEGTSYRLVQRVPKS